MKLTIKQALQQGIAAHRNGELKDAERLYRAILQSQPAHPHANHNLGVLAVSSNRIDVAFPLLKVALEADPRVEQFWLSYIDALIKGNEFDNAKQIIEQAGKEGVSEDKLNVSRDHLVLASRSILSEQTKRSILPEKRKNLAQQKKQKKTRKQNSKPNKPNNAMPREYKNNKRVPTNKEIQHISEALNNGRKELSQSLALKMIKKYPNHPLGWKIKGVNNEADGKLSEAITDAEIVVRLDSTDDEGNSNLAILYQKSGKLVKAEQSIVRAIKLNPASNTYRIIHARILELLKEQDRAQDIYKSLIKRDPRNATVRNEYGNYLYRLGNMRLALAMHQEAAKLEPENSAILMNLGKSFHTLGIHDNAKLALNKSITLNPNIEDAYYTLGVILFEESDFRNAASQLKKSSRLIAQTYLLRCYLELGSESDFRKQLKKINAASDVNAMLGSIVSRAELKFNVKFHNPFANDIYKYVHKATLNKKCNFKNLFEHLAAKVLEDENISRRSQSLLSKGEQTTGNIFHMGGALVREAEDVIMNEIALYREHHSKKTDGFITGWPLKYSLTGWLINMTRGGSLAPHMHELGWLGGAVYISVPKKQGSNEGNFVVCKDSGENLKLSSEVIDVNSGDIVLFPASLMHYTIPFTSEKNRIVLAFDMIPH